jgi:two-component system sensor histidine kinase QseC
MISIRKRLTLTLLFGILIVVIFGGINLYLFFKRSSLDRFDNYLSTKARTIAALLEKDQTDFNYELDKFLPEIEKRTDSEYFQIWMEKGDVFRKSRSLKKFNLPRRTGSLEKPEFWDLTLPDGRPGRAVGIHFIYSSDDDNLSQVFSKQPIEIVFASSKNRLKNDMRDFSIGLFAEIFLILIIIVVLVPYFVRKGVSPINTLADSVAQIYSKSLDKRFSPHELPKELKPIAHKLNELLVRLEDAFNREKRLTADIAHELKTPISELITMAEVNLNWPSKDVDNKHVFSDVLDIAKQMQNLVSTILTQVRMESRSQRINLEDVNISTALNDLVKIHKKAAEARSLKLESSISSDVMVESDRAMLYSVFNNLLGNAVQYCGNGGTIKCSLKANDDVATINIVNTNDDLTEQDLSHIFEPMWRKSSSRSSINNNSGLGLTLVKSFCDILGIKLKTELLAQNEFSVTLEILL